MKRRAPDEIVTPFRHRYHGPEAKPIRVALEEWCEEHEGNLIGAEPELPPGIEDRDADAWEPLLAVADEAGDDWPSRAREAPVYLTRSHVDDSPKASSYSRIFEKPSAMPISFTPRYCFIIFVIETNPLDGTSTARR